VIADPWPPAFLDCFELLTKEMTNLHQFLYYLEQIMRIATQMVDTIDETTVLRVFHEQAFNILSYVDGMRKNRVRYPDPPGYCPETATGTQRFRKVEADAVTLIKDLENRLIGLPNKP
jgi:hypothetical protein